jgi:uncharacterized protein YjbI with pentapeptide repeats
MLPFTYNFTMRIQYNSPWFYSILFSLIFLLQINSAYAVDCPYAGKELTKNRILKILKNHDELINEYSEQIDSLDGNTSKITALKKTLQKDIRYANLCQANFINYDLSKVNLYAANLNGVLLSNTNFKDANLNNASLIKANLSYAILSNTKMSRANLTRANLYRAKMIKTELFNANLSHADLSNTHLHEVKLTGANLAGANLKSAQLINAFMSFSNLTSTLFKKADLSNAILKDADLTNTQFDDANLTNVDFDGTAISNANFQNANLKGVNYLPDSSTFPDMGNLSQNPTLHLMTYKNNSSGLYQLRNKFKKLGFREAERKLTYAIRHTQRLLNHKPGLFSHIDGFFNYVFFEYPTDWSMNPGKAITILLILILLFTLPYSMSIFKPSSDGIWKVWNSARIRQDLGAPDAKLMTAGIIKSFFIGFQFSVLSAFHMGWKDLNVGNWISRIQPREYTLSATGWVRTVSGLQSLISVYLIAAWALTYFGRPFE